MIVGCSACGAPQRVPHPTSPFLKGHRAPVDPGGDEELIKAEKEFSQKRRRRAWSVAALGTGIFLGTCVGSAGGYAVVRGFDSLGPALLGSFLCALVGGGFGAAFLFLFALRIRGPLAQFYHFILLIGLTAGALAGAILGAPLAGYTTPRPGRPAGPPPPTGMVALGAVCGGTLGALPGRDPVSASA
ncbi:MAG TPA: hypothetical protein VMS17_23845 [Gemmataceae bacterium]|nr:hypothetical protein [Gemmataceae bacterium]